MVPSSIPGADADQAVRLAVFLARTRGLTEADVLRALTLQDSGQISFADALLHLHLATPGDIQAALSEEPSVPTLPPQLPPSGKPPVATLVGIRGLRTEIVLRQSGQRGNVLAVVAAAQGDGASRLAAELAVSFAQLAEPTLLIDADLRQSQQQQIFGLGNRAGLVEALSSNAPIAFAGVDGLPHLTVLAAGKRPANPQELLASAAFGRMVEDARNRFRHVIIDTPDSGSSSDALLIAMAAGCALPVSRIDSTPLPVLTELVRRLRAASVRVIGGVLNAAVIAQ